MSGKFQLIMTVTCLSFVLEDWLASMHSSGRSIDSSNGADKEVHWMSLELHHFILPSPAMFWQKHVLLQALLHSL